MNNKIYKLTLTALFAALIYVATNVFIIPLPGNGYANFGDCFCIVAGFVLGPAYGACAAGLGSALSDLILGYGIYIPATLVIKAVVALSAYYVLKILSKHISKNAVSICICSVVAEICMIAGYFLFEFLIFGIGIALPDIIGNALQGAVGAIAASIFCNVMIKTGLLNKLTHHL